MWHFIHVNYIITYKIVWCYYLPFITSISSSALHFIELTFLGLLLEDEHSL